jgi:hypothetical protein
MAIILTRAWCEVEIVFNLGISAFFCMRYRPFLLPVRAKHDNSIRTAEINHIIRDGTFSD